MEFKKEVKERFLTYYRFLQEEFNLTKKSDMAEKMEISVQSLSQILYSDRMPTIEQIAALIRNTRLNANWLLNEIGPMQMTENKEPNDKDIKESEEAINQYIDMSLKLKQVSKEKDMLWELVNELRMDKQFLRSQIEKFQK